jgi:hypothetical protein
MPELNQQASREHRSVIVALFHLSALTYSTWVIAPWLGSELSPLTSYVSELYADGQPFALLFRASDALAGTALLTAMLLWKPPRSPAWWRLGRWSIFGFGLFTILDAAFPMSCTPTADPVCEKLDAAFAVSLSHNIHNVTSTLAGVFLLAASIAVALALAKHDPLMPATWVTWTLAISLLATSLWTVWEIVAFEYIPLPEPDLLGLAQRIQILLAVLWLLYVPHHLRTQTTTRSQDG